MIRSAIICLLLTVALCPDLVSAQRSEWNRTDLSDAALVGIIIGVIFFVIILIALIFMCLCFLGQCFQRNDYYYNEPYYPEPPLPPLPPPAPEAQLAVVVARPRPQPQSRPVFVIEKERIPSPPSKRAFLVRDRIDDRYYDPYDIYDDRKRGGYY